MPTNDQKQRARIDTNGFGITSPPLPDTNGTTGSEQFGLDAQAPATDNTAVGSLAAAGTGAGSTENTAVGQGAAAGAGAGSNQNTAIGQLASAGAGAGEIGGIAIGSHAAAGPHECVIGSAAVPVNTLTVVGSASGNPIVVNNEPGANETGLILMASADGTTFVVRTVKIGANNTGPGGAGRALFIDDI